MSNSLPVFSYQATNGSWVEHYAKWCGIEFGGENRPLYMPNKSQLRYYDLNTCIRTTAMAKAIPPVRDNIVKTVAFRP